MNYDREPYQDLVGKTECDFCGEVLTEYKFCSDECAEDLVYFLTELDNIYGVHK